MKEWTYLHTNKARENSSPITYDQVASPTRKNGWNGYTQKTRSHFIKWQLKGRHVDHVTLISISIYGSMDIYRESFIVEEFKPFSQRKSPVNKAMEFHDYIGVTNHACCMFVCMICHN
ncbi:hypothetical protein OUZ56_019149 [Daphnia magna]|uniref:Uncharacterized protein n=1 Tax=Daphnia magna TaxID=35525 RepID=A0ABQ9ZAU1_9CRUS|nr:hypothetical protein OUZ56_019149 [Daphnia magna]